MLANKLIITEQDHLTAQQLSDKLKPYIESTATLQELTLSRAIVDTKSLNDLCQCISEAKTLVYFNFTATLLTSEGRTKLLDACAENKSLEKIYLSDCLLSSVNEISLINVITKHPLLNYLDISEHTLTSLKNVEKAIRRSQSLESVVGCNLSADTQVALEQNKRFAQLDSYLKKWQALPLASNHILKAHKRTFYKIIEQAKAINKNDKRVNQFIADFSRYLANQYQQLDDLENARKYYEKYIEGTSDDPAKQNEAHFELASLFYTSASAIKDSISDAQDESSRVEMESKAHQCLLMGYPHVIKSDTAELKNYYTNYMAEEFIRSGQELLDKNKENPSAFKRIL